MCQCPFVHRKGNRIAFGGWRLASGLSRPPSDPTTTRVSHVGADAVPCRRPTNSRMRSRPILSQLERERIPIFLFVYSLHSWRIVTHLNDITINSENTLELYVSHITSTTLSTAAMVCGANATVGGGAGRASRRPAAG